MKLHSGMSLKEYMEAMEVELPGLSPDGWERMYALAMSMLLTQEEKRAAQDLKERRPIKKLPAFSGLNLQFCRRRPAKKLCVSKRAKRLGWALPFATAKDPWPVPSTGGYQGGWEAGTAIAWLYLKNCRRPEGVNGYQVIEILQSMVNKAEMVGGFGAVIGEGYNVMTATPEQQAMRGQCLAFLKQLGDWASLWAVNSTGPHTEFSEAQLIGLANRGLAYDEAAATAHYVAEDEAEDAAWKARRRAAITAKRRSLREARKAAAAASPPDEYVEPERLAA